MRCRDLLAVAAPQIYSREEAQRKIKAGRNLGALHFVSIVGPLDASAAGIVELAPDARSRIVPLLSSATVLIGDLARF